MVWWSTHRTAAREVRGSNLGLGILFSEDLMVIREKYLYARVTEIYHTRGDRSVGWMGARDRARAVI